MPGIEHDIERTKDRGLERPKHLGSDNIGAADNSPMSQRLLLIFVGIPGIALLTLLFAWLLLPMFMMPALYVMGFGVAAATIVCMFAGAGWAVALTTWTTPKNALMILGSAAFAAGVYHFTGVLGDTLGPWAPAYGAIAMVSVVSCTLEHPSVRPRLMWSAALLGSALGGVIGVRLPQGVPRVALWITVIAIHAVIALSAWRSWTLHKESN